MDTKEKNRQQRRPRPEEQKRPAQSGGRKAPAPNTQQRKKPAQPQSAAQRRAVKHQQAQRQTAVQEQQAAKRRPAQQQAAPKRRKPAGKNPLNSLKLPQFGKPASARSRREQAARAAKLKAMKQEVTQKAQTEQAQQTRRRVSKPRRPAQPIIYTAPKTFNAHRLVLQLISITAIALAAIVCLSIFFKVEVIEVSGASVYDEWTVREASGIQLGDNLLTFSRGRAGGKIKAELQYVDKVRFGIKLPNTVIIDIEEFDVVYAVKSSDGTWYLINSDGKVIEQTDGGTAGNYTKILGVTLSAPIPGEQARAAEEIVAAPESTKPQAEDSTEETVPQVLITNQSRLETALQILRSLELNGIVGEAASVDVSDLSRIELWYGTRYQVNLGDVNDMDKKIADMKATISQLAEYQTGGLDISYMIQEDKVVYTPFE